MQAGNNDHPVSDPDTHIYPGDKEPVAVLADLPPVLAGKPNPLAHRDLPCKGHAAVTPSGMLRKEFRGPLEQDSNPFVGQSFCIRTLWSPRHQAPVYLQMMYFTI
jgi:hypothetical protein